jgi:Protein prenyltransferase alpha subunit repeat
MVAQRYPKNYYAWTHRLFCIRQADPSLVMEEWNFVTGWFPQHVSDHSAVHYGGQVLQILQITNKGTIYAQNAMREAKRLVELFPTHEVLWIFRRVCASTMLQLSKQDTVLQTTAFVQHIQDEWKDDQETKHPTMGSELELEWRQTHVYRLSYIVWVAHRCQFIDHKVIQAKQKAIEVLNQCNFIPYNLWRIEDGLS